MTAINSDNRVFRITIQTYSTNFWFDIPNTPDFNELSVEISNELSKMGLKMTEIKHIWVESRYN